MFIQLRGAALATSALVSLAASSASAQGAAPTPSPVQLSDIVVTATRSESLASKTPIALTAITGEGLREAGVTQPINLVERVPSLEVNRSRGGLNFTMRGVANTDTSEKGDSSTAFLLDGVYIARAPMRDATFYDISRVEVLRGPQGTLYGRNTTAGVISVISNRPTFVRDGSVDVTLANYDTRQFTAAFNLPVSENLALRAAVDYENNGSYLRGGALVDPSYKKAREILAGRLSALYKWKSGEVVIRGDYADISGANFYSLPLGNFFSPPAGVGATPLYIGGGKSTDDLLALNVTSPWTMYRKNNAWGVSADLTQELGPVTFFYLGAYRAMGRDEQFSNILANGLNATRQRTIEQDWQQSHEVRLALNSIDKLKVQVGAYYFRESSNVIQRANSAVNLTPNGEAGPSVFFDIRPSAAESYAFFGQGTYSPIDALRITAGIRDTHDTKTRRGFGNIVCNNNFFTCAVPPGLPETEHSDFASARTTWKIGVDFDLAPHTLVYATVATGYKAGGFNNGCALGAAPGCTVPASTLYFAPEGLTSYEGGIKSRLWNNAAQINASVFHYDYDQLQLTQVLSPCPSTPNLPASTCTFTRNAAKAKVDGVELEGTLTPSSLDRLDLSAAYLHARYTDFQIRPTINLSGQPLNRAPLWAASAGYQHTFPLAGAYTLVAGARTRVSASYVILFEGGANFYRQPGVTETDLTLTLNAPSKRWYVQGFAKNLENRVVINDVTSGSNQQVSVNEPRTYGVRAGFKF